MASGIWSWAQRDICLEGHNPCPERLTIVVIVFGRGLFRVPPQNLDDLPSTISMSEIRDPRAAADILIAEPISPFMANTLAGAIILQPTRILAARAI